jgi:hypothetical protein
LIFVCEGLCRRIQPAFGVPQPHLHALELAHGQEGPDQLDAQYRPDPNDLVGKRLQPAEQGRVLPALAQSRDRQLDQLRGSLKVRTGQRVVDRLGPFAVLLVPVARSSVQNPKSVGLFVQQPRVQRVGKEMVVAVPLAPVVEGDQEQVSSVESLERGLAAVLGGDGFAQRVMQSAQDGGVQSSSSSTTSFGKASRSLSGVARTTSSVGGWGNCRSDSASSPILGPAVLSAATTYGQNQHQRRLGPADQELVQPWPRYQNASEPRHVELGLQQGPGHDHPLKGQSPPPVDQHPWAVTRRLASRNPLGQSWSPRVAMIVPIGHP